MRGRIELESSSAAVTGDRMVHLPVSSASRHGIVAGLSSSFRDKLKIHPLLPGLCLLGSSSLPI